jgi:hypothetical protein
MVTINHEIHTHAADLQSARRGVHLAQLGGEPDGSDGAIQLVSVGGRAP